MLDRLDLRRRYRYPHYQLRPLAPIDPSRYHVLFEHDTPVVPNSSWYSESNLSLFPADNPGVPYAVVGGNR